MILSKKHILALAVVVFYGYNAVQIYKLCRPPYFTADHATTTRAASPQLAFNETAVVHLYLSHGHDSRFIGGFDYKDPQGTGTIIVPQSVSQMPLHHIDSIPLQYIWDSDGILKSREKRADGTGVFLVSLSPTSKFHSEFAVPHEYRTNSTLYVHTALTRPNSSEVVAFGTSTPLSRVTSFPPERERKAKRLLLERWLPQVVLKNIRKGAKRVIKQTVQGVPKKFVVSLVVEHNPLRRDSLVQSGFGELINSEGKWMLPPVINLDVTPRDEYVPLPVTPHDEEDDLNIRISYMPMSFFTWNFRFFLTSSFKQMEEKFGFAAYDIDSLKSATIGQGTPIVAAIGLIVSVLHMVFEFLAMSSDIQFWRERASFTEFSPLALQLDLLCEAIVLLYLRDCGESKVVQIFLAARLLINVWKLSRFDSVKAQMEQYLPSFLRSKKVVATESVSESETAALLKKSNESDELSRYEKSWMMFLMKLFTPVIIGVTSYQLIFVEQGGWYSWVIRSLALCAYTGGFVATTPQLFRNYKLKRTDHLPWHVLSYQACNTFVDDLFSFVIRMPDMHRYSVFRDDIVFVIFHYQRWLYRKNKAPETEGESKKDL